MVAGSGLAQEAGDARPMISTDSPTYDPGINTPETKPTRTPKVPKPVEEVPSFLPQDGTLLVGKDVKPGTYQTKVPADSAVASCYWARLSDVDGNLSSIIDNDMKMTAGAVMTLRVRSSDYAVEINCNGATWKRVG
jgi:hypothetical protein